MIIWEQNLCETQFCVHSAILPQSLLPGRDQRLCNWTLKIDFLRVDIFTFSFNFISIKVTRQQQFALP